MKKNWWLKLDAKFFDDKRVKKIRRMAGGDTYTIIYLKMLILSLGTDNYIYFDEVENTIEEELASELNEKLDNVKATLILTKSLKMIEISDSDEDETLFFPDALKMTGSETKSAERVRNYRARKKNQLAQNGSKALQCNTDVTTCNKNVTTEKELEKDLEFLSLALLRKKLKREEKVYEIEKIDFHKNQNQYSITIIELENPFAIAKTTNFPLPAEEIINFFTPYFMQE